MTFEKWEPNAAMPLRTWKAPSRPELAGLGALIYITKFPFQCASKGSWLVKSSQLEKQGSIFLVRNPIFIA